MTRRSCGLMLLGVVLSVLGSGCERLDEKRADRLIERAESQVAEGDLRSALNTYESALDGSAETAEVHYRMAILYDDKLKDPITALAHFRRYLALAPSGKFSGDAANFAKEDELKTLTLLTKGSLTNQQEVVRLRNENLDLRKMLSEARARVKTLAEAHPTVVPAGEPEKKPIPPGARTYTVQPGDTLAAIPRKFYKTPGKWKDIQDANFNQLEGTVKLQPGQQLIIP